METTTEHKRVCPFCGKVIKYEEVHEDGYDWEGHHRGSSSTRIRGENKCSCEKILFKRMCVNCMYYNSYSNECIDDTNMRNLLKEINSSESALEVADIKVKIRNPLLSCKSWKLDIDLIGKYFK